MPDRPTFNGSLISMPSRPGDPHVIHLESPLIKLVDEAVKCAMEGTEDIKRFIVVPEPPKPPKPMASVDQGVALGTWVVTDDVCSIVSITRKTQGPAV